MNLRLIFLHLMQSMKRLGPAKLRRLSLVLGCSLITGACLSNENTVTSLAPAPPHDPAVDQAELSDEEIQQYKLAAMQPASGPTTTKKKDDYAASLNCRPSERLDRQAAVAYQWGNDQRNRLSFDMDGLELNPFGGSSAQIEKIRFEYRLKLQKHKNKKEKCKGTNNWQGMVGSGYRELIEREENTIWDEAKELKDKFF